MSAFVVHADQLLITTKGDSIIITKSKKVGDDFIFSPRDGGRASKLPMTSIVAFLPVVTPGKEYTVADVKEALDKITEAKPDHLRARKNINLIETEWYTLRRSLTSDVGRKIDYELSRYRRSKTTSGLNTAILNLEMLKLKYAKEPKDVALVKKAMDDLKKEYLGVDVDKYIADSKTEKMTIPAFLTLKKVADITQGKQGFNAEKKAVNTALDGARETLLKTYTPYAKRVFTAKSSLDSYIKGKTILVMLLNDVAKTSEQIAGLEAEVESLDAMAKVKLNKIDFSHDGFPLLESDLVLLQTMQDYSSVTDSRHVEVPDEMAYMVPHKEPVVVAGDGGGVSASFNVILKFADMVPKEYGVMLVFVQYRQVAKYYFPLPQIKITSGRAKIPFRSTFESMRGDVRPLNDSKGKCVLLYLVKRDSGEDKDDDEGWVPVSKACRMPWPDDY